MASMMIEKGVGWVKVHRLEPGTEGALVAALERMQRGEAAVDTEAAIQKLAGELPEGFSVEMNIEKGSGTVDLYYPDPEVGYLTAEGIERDDATMGEHLLAALERAKELEKEAKP